MGLEHAFGAGEVKQASSSMTSPRADGGRSQMSELDRFGLTGLLATLREGEESDQTHLALGMNLNSLGLDLHRPEYVTSYGHKAQRSQVSTMERACADESNA